MAGQTTTEWVCAISNAGGLGILGATRMNPDQLLTTIKKIKKNTIKPFGVNLWIGPSINRDKNQEERSVPQFLNEKVRKPLDIPLKSKRSEEKEINNNIQNLSFGSKYDEQVKIILEEDVPVVSFVMGDPVKYVHNIHSKGIKVMSMVTNVKNAVTLANNGSDVIMAKALKQVVTGLYLVIN